MQTIAGTNPQIPDVAFRNPFAFSRFRAVPRQNFLTYLTSKGFFRRSKRSVEDLAIYDKLSYDYFLKSEILILPTGGRRFYGQGKKETG